MDKKYVELFKDLTKSTAVLAEQVMDYDHDKGDDKGFDTAKIMRDDFEALHDKLASDDFDGTLVKSDYAKLLVASLIISNNLRDRLNTLKKAIAGYESDLIPKLQNITKDEITEEEVQKLANKNFIIDNNK